MPKLPSGPQHIRGKVLAFNISPKGNIEGALVETGAGPVQLNFPKHHPEGFAKSMKVGAKIDLEVESEAEEGDHPVYAVRDEQAEASGTIVRMNYALHGEENGVHLDDETFLHLKPVGAKKHKLHVGDRVKATGERRTGTDAVVLEVRTIERVAKRRENGTLGASVR